MKQLTLEIINSASKNEFVDLLGSIFEHSPWVCEKANIENNFQSLDQVFGELEKQVYAASDQDKINLLCAHPDLAGKAALAGDMTDHSVSEQKGAGLDRLTKDELQLFNQLNSAYSEKFGFPFIIAVAHHDKHSILKNFEIRLNNERAEEVQNALEQVCEIARLRFCKLSEEV